MVLVLKMRYNAEDEAASSNNGSLSYVMGQVNLPTYLRNKGYEVAGLYFE